MPMMQIFAIEEGTSTFQCSGNYQRIVPGQTVLFFTPEELAEKRICDECTASKGRKTECKYCSASAAVMGWVNFRNATLKNS